MNAKSESPNRKAKIKRIGITRKERNFVYSSSIERSLDAHFGHVNALSKVDYGRDPFKRGR